MDTLYYLEVIRATEVDWQPGWKYRKVPSLYVEVWYKGGPASLKTYVMENSYSPNWNDPLVFPCTESSKSAYVLVHLKHRTSKPVLKEDPVVGIHCIDLLDLLKRSERNNEVLLPLRHPPQRRIFTRAGILTVRFTRVARSPVMKQLKTDIVLAEDDINSLIEEQDLYHSFAELVQYLKLLAKTLEDVASVHPYLNAAYKVGCLVLSPIIKQFEKDKKLIKLVRTMRESYMFAKDAESIRSKFEKIGPTFILLMQNTFACCHFVQEYTRNGFLKRMLHAGSDDKMDGFIQEFGRLKTAVNSGIALQIAATVADISEKVDLVYLKCRLNPSISQYVHHELCSEGTHTVAREVINEWAMSLSSRNILWLCGAVRSGKSTIAMSIVDDIRKLGCLGAYIPFDREHMTPAHSIICTLAYKLAETNACLAKHIDTAVRKGQDIVSAPPKSQFRDLILEPLSAAAADIHGPIVIVLDALDGCGTPETRKYGLMQIIKNEFVKLPSKYRVFITSRPEPDIEEVFESSKHVLRLDLTGDHETLGEDETMKNALRIYIPHDKQLDKSGSTISDESELDFLGEKLKYLLVRASSTVHRISHAIHTVDIVASQQEKHDTSLVDEITVPNLTITSE